MNFRTYQAIGGGILLFIFGILLAYYHQGIIVIHRQPRALPEAILAADEKKEPITLHFFKPTGWAKETTELIISRTNKALALQRIVLAWLTTVDEESLMKKKVTILHVLLHASEKEISICFDRSPFDKQMSTYDKLMWLEGLLKTIHGAQMGIEIVSLNVHHLPLHDYHLDFSHPWPVEGYVTTL